MTVPAKTARKGRTTNPRSPAAKGRRGRVSARTAHPYAVMVYRLSMAVLATIVILNLAGRH